jgi:antitoxin Phd
MLAPGDEHDVAALLEEPAADGCADGAGAEDHVSRHETVVLERYGRPAAVLISPERYEELMDALEESEDVTAFDAAMAEDGPDIPWEQVKADLGWT